MKSFWTYQASTPTPSLEEAIRVGAIHPSTTEKEWNQISPGYKRELVRTTQKQGVRS